MNHTKTRLEGQFHFPLPQDASISGFGMWINGELIEADVVEKQRAREIYETILRERRDPGLLEWAGGNIFKARVFPIEPHSEKRIKITYTQVLPMRANKYKYSYALRSEMLQKTPLRELSLDVQVSSALPLKSVTCPTHTVRTDLTENAASVEFSAQEFTPKRDFEIVCEVDHKGSDVVMVPHQRGDDGYFLAQITPPSPEGSWQRDILPNGDPVNGAVGLRHLRFDGPSDSQVSTRICRVDACRRWGRKIVSTLRPVTWILSGSAAMRWRRMPKSMDSSRSNG